MNNRFRQLCIGLVASLLILASPAAAFAATDESTNDAPPAAQTQQTGPTSPPGADGKTYHLNQETGNWENDHYIWNPSTGKTTPKAASDYSYNPDTKTWDTTDWQYNAASGKYDPVPVKTTPTTVDNTTSAGLDNTITSTAQTGDATVSGNTTGGSATTGNASAVANVINLLQSSLSTVGNSGGVVTFMANIPGDVTGNLLVDPASIAQNQGTQPSTELQAAQGVEVHNQNDGQINNAIILNASSGNAGVIANTSAGSATSGNATAVANIVNMMNSSVGANQSFVGVINVQGDLTGDILFPTGFLDSLIASNNKTTTDVTNTNNQAIANNVNATATSGTADVSHNTTAGNATSGTALTGITVMNLTGSEIIGNNALLVFVNVGGKWTGLIMNAPGATSATLGGGITQDTSTAQQLVLANTNNQAITNDASVAAHSGDATVSNNTAAGNATSGNATATVNLANIINSQISLSHWFGILFINVLGNWNGSFGSAPAAATTSAPNSTSGGATDSAAGQLFSFIAGTTTGATPKAQQQSVTASGATIYTASAHGSNGSVLGSEHDDGSSPSQTGKASAAASHRYNIWLPIIGFLLGGFILGSDRLVVAFRRG